MATKTKPNLNEATRTQLLKVDNIGPILSDRLLANLPFESWRQVEKLNEVGPHRISKLKAEFDIRVKVEDQRVKVEDRSHRSKLKINVVNVQVKVEDQQEEQVKVEHQQRRRPESPELAGQVRQNEQVERTIETQDSVVEIQVKVQSKAASEVTCA